MKFFKKEIKEFASEVYDKPLQELYKKSEAELLEAAVSGKTKNLRRAMKNHQRLEYAMLFRNTPEFRNKYKIEKQKNKGR